MTMSRFLILSGFQGVLQGTIRHPLLLGVCVARSRVQLPSKEEAPPLAPAMARRSETQSERPLSERSSLEETTGCTRIPSQPQEKPRDISSQANCPVQDSRS